MRKKPVPAKINDSPTKGAGMSYFISDVAIAGEPSEIILDRGESYKRQLERQKMELKKKDF